MHAVSISQSFIQAFDFLKIWLPERCSNSMVGLTTQTRTDRAMSLIPAGGRTVMI